MGRIAPALPQRCARAISRSENAQSEFHLAKDSRRGRQDLGRRLRYGQGVGRRDRSAGAVAVGAGPTPNCRPPPKKSQAFRPPPGEPTPPPPPPPPRPPS